MAAETDREKKAREAAEAAAGAYQRVDYSDAAKWDLPALRARAKELGIDPKALRGHAGARETWIEAIEGADEVAAAVDRIAGGGSGSSMMADAMEARGRPREAKKKFHLPMRGQGKDFKEEHPHKVLPTPFEGDLKAAEENKIWAKQEKERKRKEEEQ